MAGSVVFSRPFALQVRLCFAITLLLPPICTDRIAAVMKDRSSRHKSQFGSLVLQPPAEVYIITGHAKLGIEPAHGLKRSFTKCHVAARNMFSLAVRKQNVDWPTGRIGNAICNQAIAGRGNVGSA